jgi:hypothetical protein
MKKVKVQNISFGIEEMITVGNVKNDRFVNYELLEKILSSGIRVTFFDVLCQPNETPEDFMKSINFIDEVCTKYKENSNVGCLVYGHDLDVGSRYYDRPEKYGIIYENWKPVELHTEINYMNDIITKIPKNFYCKVTAEEYNRRHKIIQQLMKKHMTYYFTAEV